MAIHTFGTFEAKNRLSHLLDLVEQGDEVVITRNGKPVALVSKDGNSRIDRARKAAERLRRRREAMPKDVLKGISIKELIEEGRL